MLHLTFRDLSQLSRYWRGSDALPGHPNRCDLPRQLISVCASFLLMLIWSASFAANDVSGEPHAIAAVQADEELRALLLQVELQISTGHTSSPADNNALNTWPHVVKRAVPASPESLKALADFVARVQNRAIDEKAAGRTKVSNDLTLFEDLAAALLVNAGAAPASLSNSQAATSEHAQEDRIAPPPVAGMANRNNIASSDVSASTPLSSKLPDLAETGTSPARTPLNHTPDAGASSAMGVADMNAGHPAPTAAGKSALAILATRLPKTTPIEQEQAMAAMYASRGDAMLAIKDISAARKFYEYAANCGNARAATALAGTYDPAFLAQLNAVGVRPDPALAADWYRRATTLGAPDAEARLHALGTQVAK